MSLIPQVQAPVKVKKRKLTKRQQQAWVKSKNKALVKQVESANASPFQGGCYARWRKAVWKVTADQIRTLTDATFSDEWDLKDNKRDPSEATFKYPLYKDLSPSTDIAAEIRSWQANIGNYGYLYLGGTLFGIRRMYRLTGVEVSDVDLIRGEIVHCEIKLTFTESKRSAAARLPKRRRKKATKKKKTTVKKKKTAKKTTKKR